MRRPHVNSHVAQIVPAILTVVLASVCLGRPRTSALEQRGHEEAPDAAVEAIVIVEKQPVIAILTGQRYARRMRARANLANAKGAFWRSSSDIIRRTGRGQAPSQTARNLEFRPTLARRIVRDPFCRGGGSSPAAHEAFHGEGNSLDLCGPAYAHEIRTTSQKPALGRTRRAGQPAVFGDH